MAALAGALLPGFGASSSCWKCKGSGVRLKGKMGARQRRRRLAASCGAEDDGSCVVCGGSGVAARAGKLAACAASPGRVTAPRSAASAAMGPRAARIGAPRAGEELCCLAGDWRVFQRVGGHRYSTEDVVTAAVAGDLVALEVARGRPVRHVDVGTGVGSVLQLVAWQCLREDPGGDYAGVGVEAQQDSADLARRSVAYNGAPCSVVDGDLRALERPPEGFWAAGDLRLVTGTPPYFNVAFAADGRATTDFGAFPSCEQSAGARYEFRGGVEAYCEAAARLLRAPPRANVASGAPATAADAAPPPPPPCFVCCEGGLHVNLARVHTAARAAGLLILRHLPVVGRAGKPPLFGVWVMRLAVDGEDDVDAAPPPDDALVVRDSDGRWTPAYEALLGRLAML